MIGQCECSQICCTLLASDDSLGRPGNGPWQRRRVLKIGAGSLAGAREGGDCFAEPAITRLSVLAEPRFGVFLG